MGQCCLKRARPFVVGDRLLLPFFWGMEDQQLTNSRNENLETYIKINPLDNFWCKTVSAKFNRNRFSSLADITSEQTLICLILAFNENWGIRINANWRVCSIWHLWCLPCLCRVEWTANITWMVYQKGWVSVHFQLLYNHYNLCSEKQQITLSVVWYEINSYPKMKVMYSLHLETREKWS